MADRARRAGGRVAAGRLLAAAVLVLAAGSPTAQTTARTPMPERMTRDAAELERVTRNTPVPARSTRDEVEPARNWEVRASVRAGVTATSNSGVTDRQTLGSDAIVEVAPRVELRHVGGGLQVDGDLELNALGYLGGTQPNRVLPRGRLRVSAEAIEDWLSIEGRVAVDQTNDNPFAARGDGASALNKVDTWQWRIAPVLARDLSPTVSMRGHLGYEATERRGDYAASDPRRDQRRRDARYQLEAKPRPLGGSVEFVDDLVRYVNETSPVLQLTEARLVGSWMADPGLVLGVVAGTGRTRYLGISRRDDFGGLRVRWTPGERTVLAAAAERRFFGAAFDVELNHRSPFAGLYVNLQRQPSGQPTSLLLNPGGDVAGLLDAIFTTRFPNPAERAVVVQRVLDGLGRPSALTRPVEVFSDYAQLQRRANVALVLQGRRTTASLRLLTLDARQLATADTPFVPTPGFGADSRQRLVSVDVNHRLAPGLAVDLSLARGRLEGLGLIDGSTTDERIARMVLTWAASPNLDLSAGLRRQLVESSLQPTSAEWALVLGALYRH